MPPAADGTTALVRFLELAGLVATPFATLGGLLYYFGWVRTNAVFGHFGIDASLVAYTPQDYLLRSAGVAFRPCAALLAGAALALAVHRLMTRLGPAALIELGLAGLVVTAAGLAVLFGRDRETDPLHAAVGLVAGALLIELAASRWPGAEGEPAERILRRGIVAGLVVVGLFWAFSVYAQRTGERVAVSLAAGSLAEATVLSVDDLGLAGAGIRHTRSGGASAFPHRYDGLRLLVYRNDRWFLLPRDWRSGAPVPAVVLRDDDRVRVELRRTR
ncbi:hypothetical protein [Symbioplanes lichenis]|uniref:hypothetical protein n=1 Tax=Symbioplanes lichenis TaxID=1629072 RepID=UPI0027395550|nr:hypothetical protein [Actinoplanes lichenis]